MYLVPAQTTEEILEQNKRLVEQMLFKLGYRPDLKGFGFTRDAVLLLAEDRQLVFGITKRLYPEIAEMNGASVSVVERGIRNSTALAWDAPGHDGLRSHFPEQFSRPTNRTALSFLVSYYEQCRKN